MPGTTQAIALWTVQITINTLWSGVFFGLRRMAIGGIIIAGLWVAVAATLATFWQHDLLAAILLVPYLLWVSLALCAQLVCLGPQQKRRLIRAAHASPPGRL
jgi:benzodiazapine receptor